MKQLFELIKVYLHDRQTRLSIALTVVTILALSSITFFREDKSPPPAAVETSDGFIPDGYVLVPLDLQNREALDALIGAFAVVDLFTTSMDGKTKGERVGKRLKLVRSPDRPDQFAALVPEDQASLLLGQATPLFAVIQSRKTKKEASLVQKSNSTNRIRHYEGEKP